MSICEPQTERELLMQMNEKLDRVLTCTEDHEVRIRNLESSFWKTIGLASTIAFFAGFFGSKVGGNG